MARDVNSSQFWPLQTLGPDFPTSRGPPMELTSQRRAHTSAVLDSEPIVNAKLAVARRGETRTLLARRGWNRRWTDNSVHRGGPGGSDRGFCVWPLCSTRLALPGLARRFPSPAPPIPCGALVGLLAAGAGAVRPLGVCRVCVCSGPPDLRAQGRGMPSRARNALIHFPVGLPRLFFVASPDRPLGGGSLFVEAPCVSRRWDKSSSNSARREGTSLRIAP